MRVCDLDGTWSPWTAFTQDMTWTLSPGDGVKTVTAQVQGTDGVHQASDTIVLDEPATLSPEELPFPIFIPLVRNASQPGESCGGGTP
jgi:hypothetical protein